MQSLGYLFFLNIVLLNHQENYDYKKIKSLSSYFMLLASLSSIKASSLRKDFKKNGSEVDLTEIFP